MSYVLLFFTSFYYWLLVQITYIGPFTAAFSVLVYRERFHQYELISKLSCIPNSPSTELEFGSINKSKQQRRRSNIIRTVDGVPAEQQRRRSNIIRTVDGVPADHIVANRQTKPDRVQTSGGSRGGGKIMSQGKPREKEIINPNKLRILGGVAKGKKIDSPDVYLRPMMAKVREAIFSTYEHIGLFQSNYTRVLDMFAGSGSVGLEALSRGAAHATFVDLSENCVQTAMSNAKKCGFDSQRVSSVCARAEDVLTRPADFGLTEPYQLVSVTPPYQEVVYKELIDAVCTSPLVVADTLVCIEYPVEVGSLPYILGEDKLFGVRNRKYGRTVLALYVYRPSKQISMKPEEFLI